MWFRKKQPDPYGLHKALWGPWPVGHAPTPFLLKLLEDIQKFITFAEKVPPANRQAEWPNKPRVTWVHPALCFKLSDAEYDWEGRIQYHELHAGEECKPGTKLYDYSVILTATHRGTGKSETVLQATKIGGPAGDVLDRFYGPLAKPLIEERNRQIDQAEAPARRAAEAERERAEKAKQTLLDKLDALK